MGRSDIRNIFKCYFQWVKSVSKHPRQKSLVNSQDKFKTLYFCFHENWNHHIWPGGGGNLRWGAPTYYLFLTWKAKHVISRFHKSYQHQNWYGGDGLDTGSSTQSHMALNHVVTLCHVTNEICFISTSVRRKIQKLVHWCLRNRGTTYQAIYLFGHSIPWCHMTKQSRYNL